MQQKSIELLKKYTKHDFIRLADRGNTAIFAALSLCKKLNPNKLKVLYPDQAGWFSYYKDPKKIGMIAEKVKTDFGIIDLDDLKEKVKDANCLIYSNPAGYFAEQPIKEIYEISKGRCLVILDVTACISDKRLCDGDYVDFMVGSFGEWKPVNLHYGGFISAKKEEYFKIGEEITEKLKFDNNYSDKLFGMLQNVNKRLELFYRETEKIKNDLKDYEILHKNKRGINVIVKFNNEEEKKSIINYCDKNKYEYTLCPRYIRVEENAVSIEVKRL